MRQAVQIARPSLPTRLPVSDLATPAEQREHETARLPTRGHPIPFSLEYGRCCVRGSCACPGRYVFCDRPPHRRDAVAVALFRELALHYTLFAAARPRARAVACSSRLRAPTTPDPESGGGRAAARVLAQRLHGRRLLEIRPLRANPCGRLGRRLQPCGDPELAVGVEHWPARRCDPYMVYVRVRGAAHRVSGRPIWSRLGCVQPRSAGARAAPWLLRHTYCSARICRTPPSAPPSTGARSPGGSGSHELPFCAWSRSAARRAAHPRRCSG